MKIRDLDQAYANSITNLTTNFSAQATDTIFLPANDKRLALFVTNPTGQIACVWPLAMTALNQGINLQRTAGNLSALQLDLRSCGDIVHREWHIFHNIPAGITLLIWEILCIDSDLDYGQSNPYPGKPR